MLMQFIITLLSAGLIAFASQWIIKQWPSFGANVAVAIIAAAVIFLTDYANDKMGRLIAKPSITIQTSDNGSEINIKISVAKGVVDQISLDYPVVGVITNLRDLNSITDAFTVRSLVVGGSTQYDVQNNLQMLITDIRTGSKLQYKVLYQKPTGSIYIAGTDRYELTYNWEYDGGKIQETEWRFVKGDQPTTPPAVRVVGAKVFDRALTSEEIQQSFKDGPQKRNP